MKNPFKTVSTPPPNTYKVLRHPHLCSWAQTPERTGTFGLFATDLGPFLQPATAHAACSEGWTVSKLCRLRTRPQPRGLRCHSLCTLVAVLPQ